MQKLFTEMKKHLEAGEDLVFVTVVASSGSTPRGSGARMLVGRQGRICGTIGGGTVEHQSEQLAKLAVETKASVTKKFTLRRNEVEDLGMVCGGDVTVYFRFIAGKDPLMLRLCEAALEQFNESKATWLVCELTDRADGKIGLYSAKLGTSCGIDDALGKQIKGQTCIVEQGESIYYAEQFLSSGYVYIFGGGHVAQELVPVLARLDFRCIVAEDRPEFSLPEMFPGAVKILNIDFENITAMNNITADDAIIILTRGHTFDQLVQEQALRTPAKYIGVIGSRRKTATIRQNLLDKGFTEKDLDRVTAPIGLMSLKAETPAEIAISIAGQLIALRAGAGIIS